MSQPDKAVRIACANQKGGVGKSTIAINVAAAISALDRSVLFVDLDPQGNATENLGLMEAYDKPEPNLFTVLTESKRREEVESLIESHDELDVLPSNIDMTAAEPELTVARRSGEQLDLVLQHVEDDYDYIIIDTPPYLGNLMDNALFASKQVLIPALAEATSKRAFELLFDHIGALEADYEIDIKEVGVVINRIDVRKNQANDMIEWIEDAFDDVPVWRVRERAAIQNALEAHQSLLEYEPENDMVPVFEEIGHALVEDIEVVA